MNQASADNPFGGLGLLWHEMWLPLVGVGIFVFSIVWGALTGLQIVNASPKDNVPPKIG